MGERNFIMIRNKNNINKDKAVNNRININRSNWNKMLVAGAIAGCVISGAAFSGNGLNGVYAEESITDSESTAAETDANCDESLIVEDDMSQVQASGIIIDAAHFGDEEFAGYLKEDFDKDGNGYFDSAELSEVKAIDVSDVSGIEEVQGLDLFAGLQELDVSNTDISYIDVSKNSELKKFDCSNTGLEVLNVKSNSKLEVLSCNDIGLNSLDVTANTSLYELWCRGNEFKYIDVSYCKEGIKVYADSDCQV